MTDLAWARFRVPDRDAGMRFAAAFGFAGLRRAGETALGFGTLRDQPVYVLEAGEPNFAGFGALVDQASFERALRLPSAVAIEAAGGEPAVRLADPDGFRIDVLCPPARPVAASGEPPRWNEAGRHDRANVRLELLAGPSQVRRLGHVVLGCADLPASIAWYQSTFGLRVSDFIVAPDGSTLVGAFLRCDLGPRPVDHHSVFLTAAPTPRFLHAAYEVRDLNDLMLGHDHLARAGAAHHWGIGRHILGNHIFDYWADPFGHELEHWTDGDVLDASHPPGRHGLDILLGTQWGKPHPMLQARLEAAARPGG
jgi:catechol 2,3-dioxygenase-like lactoylglutathione lyase family enzyme